MNHIFLDVHLGLSHGRMQEILEKARLTLNKGDSAIFINRAWTGVKILTHSRAFIYVREPAIFTVDMLVGAPRLCGGHTIVLSAAQRRRLETGWAEAMKRHEKKKKLKAAA